MPKDTKDDHLSGIMSTITVSISLKSERKVSKENLYINFLNQNEKKAFFDTNNTGNLIEFRPIESLELTTYENRQGVHLDGNSCLYFTPSFEKLSLNDFTIIIWFKTKILHAKDDNLILLSGSNTHGLGFDIYVFRTAINKEGIEKSTHQYSNQENNDHIMKLLKPDSWNMKAVVFSRTNGSVYEYINGELASHLDMDSFFPDIIYKIGSKFFASQKTDYFIGEISEFRFYTKTTLFQLEIKKMFQETTFKVQEKVVETVKTEEIKIEI